MSQRLLDLKLITLNYCLIIDCWQLWDSRQTSSPINQYMGHNGPTFAIDWHPEERNWVASAGRDTMVKVS